MQDLIKVAVCFMDCIIMSPGALSGGGEARGGEGWGLGVGALLCMWGSALAAVIRDSS